MVIQISAKWCGVGIGRLYAWVARVKNRGKLIDICNTVQSVR